MSWVSVSHFKKHLSRCLAAVKGGKTLVVTDRGKPVARIDPVSAADSDGVLAVLVAAGLVRPATRPLPDDFFTSPRVKYPDGETVEACPPDEMAPTTERRHAQPGSDQHHTPGADDASPTDRRK